MSVPTQLRKRIPSLDGLRAVSIAIVLLAHASGTRRLEFTPYAHMLSNLGPFGVKVFFVISGFLITTLLLNEESVRGRISISNFFYRRAFRIWPVAYAFILVVALLTLSGKITVPSHNLIYAATFTMNHVQGEGTWWTGHLWSLAVEEQFYLVWPLICFLLVTTRARCLACLAMVLIAPVARITSYQYAPPIYQAMQSSLFFVGDAIAIGCLLALLGPRLKASPLVKNVIGSKCFLIVPLLSVAMYSTLSSSLWPRFHLAIGDSISLLCIGATVWRLVHWRDFASKILNRRLFVFVGTISYSLYIWQQLFLNRYSTAWINRFPQNILAALIASILSYYLIELPFFRLRERVSNRFRPPRTSSASGQTGEEARAEPVRPDYIMAAPER